MGQHAPALSSQVRMPGRLKAMLACNLHLSRVCARALGFHSIAASLSRLKVFLGLMSHQKSEASANHCEVRSHGSSTESSPVKARPFSLLCGEVGERGVNDKWYR